MVILGTVASDLFEDEQEQFDCNTLQPGCKQMCYDRAFPISQYRFWVFHIVLIATPSLLYLMYATHHHDKKSDSSICSRTSSQYFMEDQHLKRLYIVNLCFRIVAEIGFLVGQWFLYGFIVQAQYPCSRFPCPHTVDCFTSRPTEKTVFLCFYFGVGVLSAISSCVELLHSSRKWFFMSQDPYTFHHEKTEERPGEKALPGPGPVRSKGSLSCKSSRKSSSITNKHRRSRHVSTRTPNV
ncbi:gap junction delta-3 protein-like [Parambassis ranga]|uniref:Gap junction delta-3 protein-like n=1 Tax=Parambassis ranga TaxID=210632 RepID=A0A6P7KCD9_9TELE|nr:gap junction delta-3 protein-like [Parambassis ranga]